MAAYWKNKFGYLPPPARVKKFHDKKECYSDDGREYFLREGAKSHIKNFCADAIAKYKPAKMGSLEKNYNSGMPEEMRFTMKWKSSARKSPEEVHQKCEDVFTDLLDNCQKKFKTWRHGGTFSWATNPGTDDEYMFQIDPRRERPMPVGQSHGSCQVWYKFFYNEFILYGGMFAGDDWGQKVLLPKLRNCGVVSEWKFEYYDEVQDDGVEWRSTGRLPIGAQQWNCVKNAMKDAGGPDMKCGGR
jgi:hypothetical protein